MTVKEYLGQAYLLDNRINSDTKELEELRLMSQTFPVRDSRSIIMQAEIPMHHTFTHWKKSLLWNLRFWRR